MLGGVICLASEQTYIKILYFTKSEPQVKTTQKKSRHSSTESYSWGSWFYLSGGPLRDVQGSYGIDPKLFFAKQVPFALSLASRFSIFKKNDAVYIGFTFGTILWL